MRKAAGKWKRTLIGKTAALLLASALLTSGVETSQVRAEETVAQETETGKDFLKKVIGEYRPLFEGATFDAKYDHYWHDYSAAVVGESMADDCVAMMKKAIGAATYGEDAVEDFFCGFTENVTKISFGGADGTEVTFTKQDGTTVKHTYTFVKDVTASGTSAGGEVMNMEGHLYKSMDEDSGEFNYLYMCPDTPESTYHLEFRYGDTEENILKLTDGKYKNWLAAGLSTDAMEDPAEIMLQKVIALFVIENVSAMSGEESVKQREAIAGIWDMDVTAFRNVPGYEKAELYIDLSKSGTGKSFLDMTGSGKYEQVSEYPFYIYDTDKNDGKEAGVYLVESDDEGIKTAAYELGEKDGKRVLTFHSSEGDLTYFARSGSSAPGKPVLSKLEAKGGKKLVVSWKKVKNADGYKILLSTGKAFKKTKTVMVEGKTSATVKKLQKKTYYVKVCAYTVDGAGKKVYGKYSAVKHKKVK